MANLADEIRAAVHCRGGHVEATTRDILNIVQPRLEALARERTAYALGPHVRRGNVTAQPGQRLTPREIAVLRLVATGHTNARIAAELGVPEGTVQQRLKGVFVKLRVHDRAHALAQAIATGQIIIDTEGKGEL
ncbi:response regulator transcription factor [Kitasatospora cineracea]|uniref:response regulator transcription factor n=1 Tax=Kitasatospora cineracea TaxID=88074 RepID=UPI0037A00282